MKEHMNFQNFLNYNHSCPICGEPLTLYLQWIRMAPFRATSHQFDMIEFKPFELPQVDLGLGIKSPNPPKVDPKEYILLSDQASKICAKSHDLHEKLEKEASLYLFFLCNPAGFIRKPWGDHEISLYKGCYYRSTPLFKLEDGNIELISPGLELIVNQNESFAFSSKKNDLEKVYLLNINRASSVTTLWYYVVTDEEKAKEHFRPNVFEKKIPLLKTQVKAGPEHREELLARFDNWILMS